MLREQMDSYKDWVWVALQRAGRDSHLINRAQTNFRIQLPILVEETMGQFGQITGMVNEAKTELAKEGFGLMQVEEEKSPRMQTEGDEVVMGAPMADAGHGDAPIFKNDDKETGGAMNLEDMGADLG